MPLTSLAPPKYVSPKETVIQWNNWRKGLNLLLRESEIDKSEMVVATNLLLVGSGVPSKRWGSQDFFLSSPTGATNFILPIKDSSDNQQTIALTDWGILTKKSGASYTVITGSSWPSGSMVEAAQLNNNVYIVSPDKPITRYNFTNLTSFPTLATPANTLATNISGATGTTTWSWRVTAVSRSGGETLASTPVSLASLPQNLESSLTRILWTATSAASGDLVGYNIYRGAPGDEVWVGGVDNNTTAFDDIGTVANDPFRVVPVADTTGGHKAKYIIRYQDRLILAGIPGQPTKVVISGRVPYHERYDWYAGGGYVSIEPDSGQNITGLGIYQEKLVVFKENSVWQLTLDSVTFGNYSVLNPQYKLLTASQGCSSHRSIVPMENDLAFSNRKGMYILRYEPQLLTVLNANEISAKIRPFFESLSEDDLTSCAGAYINKKYILSFPISKKTIIFDRERLSFMGPWETPFGITHWAKYVDSDGMERWIAADKDDNYVTEFSEGYTDDKNTIIRTYFKSRKEDFGDWTVFKTINEVYLNFHAVTGEVDVNIYIEDRSGATITAKSFTVTAGSLLGTSGIGTDMLGMFGLGLTENTPGVAGDEIPRKAFIYKSTRQFQVEIRTNNRTDNYELLGITATAISQARGNSPSSWVVS